MTTLACFPDRCSVVPAHPCSLPAIRLGDVCWEGARCGRLRSGTPSPLAAASLLPAAAWAPSLSPQGGSEPFNATRGNTVRRTEISSVHLGLTSAEGYGKSVPSDRRRNGKKILSATSVKGHGSLFNLGSAKCLSSLVPVAEVSSCAAAPAALS